ncbi:MAG TPA: DUF4352 domain-containing protein [Mycobacteriales bacterium]|nr:DUF4352 domain-containing protein [Mycobacteriales bacterium]
MRRITVVLACLAAALAGCSSGTDGTDVTGRSAQGAGTGAVTPQPPADKPSDYPTDTSAAPETTSGPKTFAMGYKATITQDDVGDVLHVTVSAPKTVTDPYIKPDNGRFLAVTVTYEALQPAQDINPFDLIALTKSGERLQPAFGPSVGNQLNAATLNSGESTKGTVVFDVPKTGVTGIAYAPAGQVLGTWTI